MEEGEYSDADADSSIPDSTDEDSSDEYCDKTRAEKNDKDNIKTEHFIEEFINKEAVLDHINKILIKYQVLRPAYQDITPSFADEVPFLVDGDSLMITVMMDPNWSNQLGGSSLHLVYLFERFLNIFIIRGGTFHLVFFQNWQNIWNKNWNALLHRSILIEHFSKNTENYPVHLFDHCFDKKFISLINTIRPGFILTKLDDYANCAKIFNINEKSLKHVMHINLLSWLQMDLPCIDTNHITVDISIVWGYYLDCNSNVRYLVNQYMNIFVEFITKSSKIENYAQIIEEQINSADYDIRTAIYLIAGSIYYKNAKDTNLIKIFFLTKAMMEFLELKNRCCPKFKQTTKLEKIVEDWQKCMFFALCKLKNNYNCATISDLWQGLLFGHVCRFVSTNIKSSDKLGDEVATIYENMIENFNNFGYSITPYPIQMSESNIDYETQYSLTVDQQKPKPLLPIENPLVLKFCSSILHNIKWVDASKSFFQKKYSEEHHYHSMKVITDEHDYIKDSVAKLPTDDWERKRVLRQRDLNAKYMTFYGASIEGRPLEISGVIRESKNTKKDRKQKISKKGQEIIDSNIKNKIRKLEQLDKELFDKLKADYKNKIDLPKLLSNINLALTKMYSDGQYKRQTLFLKLKVLMSYLQNNDSIETQETIFLMVREILNAGELSPENKIFLSKCLSAINCEEIAERNNLPVQISSPKDNDYWIRFQLEHLGPELIRETGGVPDARVKNFIPDPWQKELFDIVDKRQSALIVAPTSSGKTYASYYCMEKVLREGTEGIVVYVAPTKALVNQVAATVYSRFKDTKMPEGKSVYGVFTRDFRTHALTSQILVTVPQCLEILLMSPRRYTWLQRLRYVIFDEIHCIEGNLGGVSFERCLLLIRCPFLALSATIRNPKVLHNWLQQIENYKRDSDMENEYPREESYRVHLVEHYERHSDLTKYSYGNGKLHHLHPYAELEKSVIKNHKGIPAHMILSPAETIELYDAMQKVYKKSEKLKQLAPKIFFSILPENGFISRNLVTKYAAELSALLEEWYNDKNTVQYFLATINILKPREVDQIDGTGKEYIYKNLPEFIMTLKKQNMLPALIFAYDRNLVKNMTMVTTCYFESLQKSNNKIKKIPQQKEQKKNVPQPVSNQVKVKYQTKTIGSFSGNVQDTLNNVERYMRVAEKKNKPNRREMYLEKPLNLISTDPEQSLQGIGIMTADDMQFIEQRLRKDNINSKHFIAKAMRNGICLHHGGIGNKVRTAVEMLFRKRFLNVVFATGTLALGIHMPCKTTVIAGNSGYLNSLEYHQMAGRAGRRGYDNAGNVIFLGLNSRKQHSLLTAKLPYLKGNFPITVSLILRSLLLISDVTEKGSKSETATKISISRVMAMLENSFCYMGNPSLKINIKHFFSFSLQLLKMQDYIDDAGVPLKWCGLATHLHYHEPGNLALVYLFRTGTIRRLCHEIKNPIDIQYALMVILSHLFTNIPLDTSSKRKFDNSKVVLDPLPDIIHKALENYNKQVNFVFNQYFSNVASHFNEPDNILPLSLLKIVGKSSAENLDQDNLQNDFLNMCVPKLMCSSFAALSGNDDRNIYSQTCLITNIKEKMATDVKIIPLINLNAELNGYALDFYRHGIAESIKEDNGLKAGAEFTMLKDFFLILKTIIVSLEEMRVKSDEDIVYKHLKAVEASFNQQFNKAFNRGIY